jgi:YfiH family protein
MAATGRRTSGASPEKHMSVLHAPVLENLPWLVHGFSTRTGGVSSSDTSPRRRGELNLGTVPWDRAQNVTANRRRLLDALPADGLRLVVLKQIHSDLIRIFEESRQPSESLPGDGLVTRQPGLLLAVLTADCFPILLADARRRVVAALHCGWRGTVQRIAQKAVGRMRLHYGSRPEDLRAAVGPGIRACCYEVGAEVVEEFESQFVYAKSLFILPPARERPLEERHSLFFKNVLKAPFFGKKPKVHLDLAKANVAQLLEAGLAAENIWAEAPCTHCRPDLFFSHRRDGSRSGRMMAVIGIRE